MRDGALKWGLRLLGIVLFVSPFLIALGMHNWDIKAAVLPSENEMAEIQESVTGMFGGGPLEYSINSITPIGNTLRVSIRFTSPFNIPIKLKDVSASLSDQGVNVAQIQMEENEVDVPAKATVNFTLVGTYTGGLPTNLQLSVDDITLDFYGVTIRAQKPSGQGGP